MTTQQQNFVCEHCGKPAPAPIFKEGNAFCCHGCLNVHELLQEEASCEIPQAREHESYAYLDLDIYQREHVRTASDGLSIISLVLPDMHCASCVQFLEHLYKKNPAIAQSEVN
ncbi:MAG: hypothetical protein RL226_667, partial [Bacteroidota bacterium]